MYGWTEMDVGSVRIRIIATTAKQTKEKPLFKKRKEKEKKKLN